jgi:NhaP-type Na+/H+ or K+/H+ antiporter
MLALVCSTAILLATIRSGLSWREWALPPWIALPGIVAAAVAGVAGAPLQADGNRHDDLVMPAVFVRIAATMVLHGFTLTPLARRLRLTLGNALGLAIVGATD